MIPAELGEVIDQDHRALEAFSRGDPQPKKRLFSRAHDASLANPYGPPARGWSQIEPALDAAAAVLRDGESVTFERVTDFATAELAYTVDIERYRMRVGSQPSAADVSLRVTTIFRNEPGGWKIVHRHADPITTSRPAESVL